MTTQEYITYQLSKNVPTPYIVEIVAITEGRKEAERLVLEAQMPFAGLLFKK